MYDPHSGLQIAFKQFRTIDCLKTIKLLVTETTAATLPVTTLVTAPVIAPVTTGVTAAATVTTITKVDRTVELPAVAKIPYNMYEKNPINRLLAFSCLHS